uniref:Vps72/YL1 N-terminal domain-containing protein n=2 Tax=Canis lupus familiaris TaxID=9615 RepID=A0A8P0TBA2_CANLF
GLGEHGARPEGQAAQGTEEPQPHPHPDSHTQAAPGLPPWTAGSSGSPPRAAPRSGSLLERHRGEEKHTCAYEKLPLELQDDGSDSRSPCVNLQLSIHDRHSFGYKRGRASHSRQKGPHCERPLTQQELLREAKITEELNLRSLGWILLP